MTPATRMADVRDRGHHPNLRVISGGDTLEQRPEDALLAAFLAGDDEAFGELVRRNEALVFSIARRYARSTEDARDLTQRTFLRAFLAARRALGRDPHRAFPFRRWLVRIAVNVAKNHLRYEVRMARARYEMLGPAETPAVGTDEILRAERAAALRARVLQLPRRQREVMTLRLDAELPFAEIAEVLGITENAAKVTFHHATRKLRNQLAREERP